MAQDNDDAKLTEEGALVVALSRALFAKDVDLVFRKLGEHMDRNGLKVSETVLDEYRTAGRVIRMKTTD